MSTLKTTETPLAIVHEVLTDWLEQNEATDFDENDVAHLFGLLGTAGYSIVPNPPASLADAALAELEAKMSRAHRLPWAVDISHDVVVFFDEDGNGMRPNPYHPICRMEDLEDGLEEHNADYIAAACNALPCLLARLRAAEVKVITLQAKLQRRESPRTRYSQMFNKVIDGLLIAKQGYFFDQRNLENRATGIDNPTEVAKNVLAKLGFHDPLTAIPTATGGPTDG